MASVRIGLLTQIAYVELTLTFPNCSGTEWLRLVDRLKETALLVNVVDSVVTLDTRHSLLSLLGWQRELLSQAIFFFFIGGH